MTRDYYGRFINLPADHADQPDEELDSCAPLDDDDPGPIEAAENDWHSWPDWDSERAAAAAEDAWIASRDRTASQ